MSDKLDLIWLDYEKWVRAQYLYEGTDKSSIKLFLRYLKEKGIKVEETEVA